MLGERRKGDKPLRFYSSLLTPHASRLYFLLDFALDRLSTADLLKYLPNTGTLGKFVSFYYIFAYNAPYVPVVPEKGPETDLFFDDTKFPSANQALIGFRKEIESFIKWLQPDWVQTGQWPRNIEL